MRRVLITGGAGFLGTHLSESFRAAGLCVRLFDRVPPPDWAHVRGLEYVQGDIRDSAAVGEALQGAGSVVHGAFASPRQTTQLMHAVNVEGTRQLCAAALERGASRFILISSTIVTKPERKHPLLNDAPLSRLDAYRQSRAEAEQVISDFATRGLSAAIVRPKTFVGPGRVGAFAIIFDWIRQGAPVPVLGGGENRYQLLHIEDMARGICQLEASRAQGVFFFGARQFCTVREDLQTLLDYTRTGARLRFIPAALARFGMRSMEWAGLVPLSEWHQMSAQGQDSVVDILRAQRELGWQPLWSNADALRSAYDWYLASLAYTGSAPTTHPLPLSHRILKGVLQIFPE